MHLANKRSWVDNGGFQYSITSAAEIKKNYYLQVLSYGTCTPLCTLSDRETFAYNESLHGSIMINMKLKT